MPADASDKSVTWTSSNPSVAAVDSSGKVTAVGNGTAVIMAETSNGLTAACSVLVSLTAVTSGERVTGLRGVSSENGVLLIWDAVDWADGYMIGSIHNGQPYAQLGYTMTNSYTDAAASLTDYSYYWVFPFKKTDGKIVPGKCSANYAYGIRQLPAVRSLTAMGFQGGVALSWNPVAGADGYVIKVRRGTGAVTVLADISGSSYLDTGASKDVMNFYWVYPYKKSGSAKRPGVTSNYVYGKAE